MLILGNFDGIVIGSQIQHQAAQVLVELHQVTLHFPRQQGAVLVNPFAQVNDLGVLQVDLEHRVLLVVDGISHPGRQQDVVHGQRCALSGLAHLQQGLCRQEQALFKFFQLHTALFEGKRGGAKGLILEITHKLLLILRAETGRRDAQLHNKWS